MALQPGSILNGRYHILRLLGQGGMGAVYLAEDQNLGRRQVAVKENLDLTQAAQDQFQAEAVILARLRHPGLPQVSDHFILPSGAQYLVMEYVEGEDLDHILARRGPLPEPEALDWMAQVLESLQYMHTWVDPATGHVTPVVHRDIKPANIKRTPSGRIMLVDFGIAKVMGAGGTKSGARAASPGFSPLEQYTGGTDVRSDVYSAGATLYCLLTGRVPPEAPDLAAGRAILAPLRSLAPGVSPATAASVERAMRPMMLDRYQSIRDLSAALLPGAWAACPQCAGLNRAGARFCQTCGRSLLAPTVVAAPPPPPTNKRRIALWAVLGAVLLTVCGLGGSALMRLQAQPAPPRPRRRRRILIRLCPPQPRRRIRPKPCWSRPHRPRRTQPLRRMRRPLGEHQPPPRRNARQL